MFSTTLGSTQISVHRLSQVPHTRLAALPWGPRLALGRRRRGQHQRRSGLDSRQRWRSKKGLQAKNVFLTRDTE